MVILLIIAGIVLAGLPLAATVIVSVASRREEAAYSLAGYAPGRLARAARRLLAFHAQGIRPPASRAPARELTRQ